MSKGLSIHIGLNRVDPNHYQDENGDPWDGALDGCLNDARDMQKLARKRGFDSLTLIDAKATAHAVTTALQDAAKRLNKGDTLFLSYSGHGGQVPDKNDKDAEKDGYDETWCLFDRELVDDELFAHWGRFAKGVRIFVLSDSCHSGTVVRAPGFETALRMSGARVRMLPLSVANETYRRHKKSYDAIQKSLPLGDKQPVKASVVLISGCQDSQFSSDGAKNGLFTETLKSVWKGGKFKGDLRAFHKAIVKKMPPWQVPNYFTVGPTDPAFESRPPFTI